MTETGTSTGKSKATQTPPPTKGDISFKPLSADEEKEFRSLVSELAMELVRGNGHRSAKIPTGPGGVTTSENIARYALQVVLASRKALAGKIEPRQES